MVIPTHTEMTSMASDDEKYVRQRYPELTLHDVELNLYRYVITTGNLELLGQGHTVAEAWTDAAHTVMVRMRTKAFLNNAK